MIKKHLKLLIVTSVLILLPIVAGLILWNQMPEQIPTHWNAQGEIDGWMPKPLAVFGMPLLLLAVQWGCVFATSADPKKQNHSSKILHFVFWIIPVLSIVVSAVTYSSAMGTDVPVDRLLPALVGLVLVAVGNYLPKCQQNYTIGIKIPWTLHSEENWNKTHRLAGFVWVVGGALMMVAGFFGLFWLTLVPIVPMVLIPFVYSFVLHRKGV